MLVLSMIAIAVEIIKVHNWDDREWITLSDLVLKIIVVMLGSSNVIFVDSLWILISRFCGDCFVHSSLSISLSWDVMWVGYCDSLRWLWCTILLWIISFMDQALITMDYPMTNHYFTLNHDVAYQLVTWRVNCLLMCIWMYLIAVWSMRWSASTMVDM